MKRLKPLTAFISILTLLILSGCDVKLASREPADFTDPGVCAYVNGVPVYEHQIQQYKDMSMLYWQAVAELGDKPAEIEVENPEALEWVFSLNYSKAKDYLAQDDEYWTRAYYKVLLIGEELYHYSKTDAEDIAGLADKTVKQALDTGKMTYMDGSQLDVSSMLDTLSEKYGISREECANNIFKPFLRSMGETEVLTGYFARDHYKGKSVQWDGSNTEECIAYLKDLYEQYNAYTDSLLEKADIVERS